MKILIASDKFKHSLDCFEVVKAIRTGLLKAPGSFEILTLPLADGGDYFSQVMAYYTGAKEQTAQVADPLFRTVEAKFYIDKQSAYLEMAQASGLQLLEPEEYNCLETSTYGTGQLIKKALQEGVQEIIIGIGGSATNDCGIGMAAALGYRFLDKKGKQLNPVGRNLGHIHTIDSSSKINLGHVNITIASDVKNYLAGINGAAHVYGPQKGATPEMIEILEDGALNFSKIVERDLGTEMLNIEGGGAAGGLGAGSVAFLNAHITSGAELVFSYSQAEKHIQDADIVISGEGKIDLQSLQGKLLQRISILCRKYNKPLVALCGALELTPQEIEEAGISAAFSIINKPMYQEDAYTNAAILLEQISQNLGSMICKIKDL